MLYQAKKNYGPLDISDGFKNKITILQYDNITLQEYNNATM